MYTNAADHNFCGKMICLVNSLLFFSFGGPWGYQIEGIYLVREESSIEILYWFLSTLCKKEANWKLQGERQGYFLL